MRLTKTISLLFICFSVIYAEAQNAPDTISRIDYLNLNGTFSTFSNYYKDTSGASYGLFDIEECHVSFTEIIGIKAIVRNNVIAAHRFDREYLELHYPDKIVYCKFKKGDFVSFLKTNTANGSLVSRDKLRIGGKKPKLYCNIKMRSYRLVDKCK